MSIRMSAALAPIALAAGLASAQINGFVESFDAGNANWRNSGATAGLDWFAAGALDGSAYASSPFNLINTSIGGFPPTLIRGEVGNGASGGAFAGDWIAAGVTSISFDIRHSMPLPVNITGRFATPANFPGAATVAFAPVLPNTWTTITWDLTASSPNIVSLETATYEQIFGNIGRIQIGFTVPDSLAGQDLDVRLDIDNVRIVPAPSGLALLGLGGLASLRPARRRRA